MQLDKKDLPKFVVLGVLVVACVGILSFQFLRPNSAAPAPTSGNQQSTGAAGTNTTPGGAPPTSEPAKVGEDGAATQLASVSVAESSLLSTPTARRDPFLPQILAADEGAKPQPVRLTQPVVRRPSEESLRIPTGRVPPLNPLGSGMLTSVPSAAPIPTPEPRDPEFTLTGVIRGDENVAIIRTGDKGRYVVKQGQMIEGRYRVLTVSDDTAVLADQNRRISVRLGGTKNGS